MTKPTSITIENKYEGKIVIKKGLILNTNWGYDQTNVDFFKVVGIIGKRYFTVKKLSSTTKETGFMTGDKTFNPNKFEVGAKLRRAYASPDGYMNLSNESSCCNGLYVTKEKSERVSWYG